MREFWKNGAILPSLEQELPPFPSLLHAGGWGHTALQGGQYGPILAPGRVAWPHFEMGPCYPPLLLTALVFNVKEMMRFDVFGMRSISVACKDFVDQSAISSSPQ